MSAYLPDLESIEGFLDVEIRKFKDNIQYVSIIQKNELVTIRRLISHLSHDNGALCNAISEIKEDIKQAVRKCEKNEIPWHKGGGKHGKY